MKYIFILISTTLLAFWMILGAGEFWSATKDKGLRRIVTLFASTCVMIGGVGFIGSALSSMGAFNWLPSSFEWPIGLAEGVVSTKDNYFVVPHEPSRRVQIYNHQWKFVRGWHIDASGGTFKLFVSDTNHIHVVTDREQKHYEYDLTGKLLSVETYSAKGDGYSSFQTEGNSYFVPTPLWLWIFTSPIYSWAVAVVGFFILFIKDKNKKPMKKA